MSAVKIVAIVLIIAGLLGLVYGNFSYTRETQEAKIGPLELTVKDTADGQCPGLGRCGGDSGWRRTFTFCKQEELAVASMSRSGGLPAHTSGMQFCRNQKINCYLNASFVSSILRF